MSSLEDQFISDVKSCYSNVQTELNHLENLTRKPNVTVDEIEAKARKLEQQLKFLFEDIDRYRVKKDAQLRQATQARVPER